VANGVKKILVVDDDFSIRSLFKEFLEPEGYSVLQAADGRQALEILDAQAPDLLIVDRAMPGMGGIELLKALQDRHSAVPVIMISAFGEESLWGQAIGLGAQDYLLKPFTRGDVLKLVKKFTDGEKKR